MSFVAKTSTKFWRLVKSNFPELKNVKMESMVDPYHVYKYNWGNTLNYIFPHWIPNKLYMFKSYSYHQKMYEWTVNQIHNYFNKIDVQKFYFNVNGHLFTYSNNVHIQHYSFYIKQLYGLQTDFYLIDYLEISPSCDLSLYNVIK